MNKILLIIKREYLTRVRKRSFIIMTLLGPLLMGAIIPISIYIQSSGGDEKTNIIVIDNSREALYARQLSFNNKDGVIQYYPDTSSIEQAKKSFNPEIYYGLLYIFNTAGDSVSYELFTPKLASMSKVESIRSSIQKIADEDALVKNDIDPMLLAALKQKVKLKQTSFINSENSSTNATLTSILAFVSGILIYMFIFIYGAQVMRGVMEEKSSRIVEVIMSSVKPFQLMMGKILGIAMVALTQFILWALLTFGVAAVSISFMADKMGTSKEAMAKQVGSQQPAMGNNPMVNADHLEENEIVKTYKPMILKALGLRLYFTFCLAIYYMHRYLLP
ncbi:MAG: ABC transporter permease [Bacteroidetes bacterium]|nr:ABC transporter permease [Bacteroidota bacterium]